MPCARALILLLHHTAALRVPWRVFIARAPSAARGAERCALDQFLRTNGAAAAALPADAATGAHAARQPSLYI